MTKHIGAFTPEEGVGLHKASGKHLGAFANGDSINMRLMGTKHLGAFAGAIGGGWKNKPADWSDIRKDCPANSIALYAGHKEDYSQYDNLGFTAICTGGYNVFIDEKKYGTFASGSQCSITWSKYNQNLPYGYTQVEYLQSSGTQYLDLGIKGNGTTKVEVKFKYNTVTSASGSGRVFGSRTNSSSNAFAIGSSSGVVASTGNKAFWCYDSQPFYVSDNTFDLDEWQTVVFSATEHKINGTTEGDDYTVTTFETPQNLKLFAFDNNGTIGVGYVDIAYCKLWDNGVLIRNLIPCKNSSNVLGMYDTVNDVFYENAGTGDFAGGNEVYPGITTGDIITTPELLKAHKIWIEPATEGSFITQFCHQRVDDNVQQERQGTLWLHFNLTNAINLNGMSSPFPYSYNVDLMLAVTAKNNKLTLTGYNDGAFHAEGLTYVPTIYDMLLTSVCMYATKLTDVNLKNPTLGLGSYAFSNSTLLKEIKMSNPSYTNDGTFIEFANNTMLRKFPDIDWSKVKNARRIWSDYSRATNDGEPTIIDARAATELQEIGIVSTNSLIGLRVSNQAPFNGSTPQIELWQTNLDRQALVQVFNDLPTVSSGQIINIQDTVGESYLTNQDVAIATNKGWTVIGGPVLLDYYAYKNTNDTVVYTTDNPIKDGKIWKQPLLSSDGTMGGTTCAVETNISLASYTYAFNGFDGDSSTYFHSAMGGSAANGYFTFYNPVALNVIAITFKNQPEFYTRASGSGKIYGSNDNTNWTELTSYTNNSTSDEWSIDLSSNTNFYKYYKVDSTSTVGNTYWTFEECYFTAISSGEQSVLYNENCVELVPQPYYGIVDSQLINATVQGNLTLIDGVYSGFLGDAYLVLPQFLPQSNSWSFEFHIKTHPNNFLRRQLLYGGVDGYFSEGFAIELMSNGVVGCGFSSDGASWDIGWISGNTVLNTDTWYTIRVSFSGTEYKLELKEDGSSWTTEGTITSSTIIWQDTNNRPAQIGTTACNGDYFGGKADMKNTFALIGNTKVPFWSDTTIRINGSDYVRDPSEDIIN